MNEESKTYSDTRKENIANYLFLPNNSMTIEKQVLYHTVCAKSRKVITTKVLYPVTIRLKVINELYHIYYTYVETHISWKK